MAAELLRVRLVDAPADAPAVSSAGILDLDATSPAPMIAAAAKYGADLGSHTGRQVHPADVSGAALVVGMAREHVREIVLLDPAAWPRTFTLKELVRRGRAVGPRGARQPLADWLDLVHHGRSPEDLLGRSAGDDIPDPMGGPSRGYRASAKQIAELVDDLAVLAWPGL
jgi:protein-tyrosine phosphatase